MPRASWIVASHHRPDLLRATLSVLRHSICPPHWTQEIVVAYHQGDVASGRVAYELADVAIATSEPYAGGKRNAAVKASSGDLCLVTDDDDFQSPLRLQYAIGAFDDGWAMSGIRCFRRLHLASGQVTLCDGRGSKRPLVPPVFCGTARSYRRSVLEKSGGWKAHLTQLEDSELFRRLVRRRSHKAVYRELDLGDALAKDTIVVQHGANIHTRQALAQGATKIAAGYQMTGLGYYRQIADFPATVARALGQIPTYGGVLVSAPTLR